MVWRDDLKILGGYHVDKTYSNDNNSDTFNNVPGAYDPHFVANAKISYKVDKTLTASLSVKNLFDREYFQGSSKADGYSIYLGLGFKS